MLGYSGVGYVERATDDYISTLQFELRRQKEKNEVLEERMMNTEAFILRMKEMQLELQSINQKYYCELQEERKIRTHLENHEIRSKNERIIQLQHQIKVLESLKENQIQARSKENIIVKANSRKRSLRNLQMGMRESPYFDKQKEIKHDKHEQERESTERNLKQNKSERNYNHQKKEKQNQELLKLQKFTSQFLSMAAVYLKNELVGLSETKKLKVAWKWVKDVVRQWDENTQRVCSYERLVNSLEEALELPKSGNIEAVEETVRMLCNLEKEDEAD